MGVSEALPDLAASADALEELHRLPVDDPRRALLRDAIVEAHLPLVQYLAGRYRHLGEPLDDLVQVGTIGLINAVDRFDPTRGTTLATYATPTIVGEIKRYFRDRVWSVRVPRRLQELHARLGAARATLAQELGRQPTVREIAERLGVDVEDALEALEALHTSSTVPLTDEPGGQAPVAEPTRPSRTSSSASRCGPCCTGCPSARSGSSRCGSFAGSANERSPTSSASRRCTCHACSPARSTPCAAASTTPGPDLAHPPQACTWYTQCTTSGRPGVHCVYQVQAGATGASGGDVGRRPHRRVAGEHREDQDAEAERLLTRTPHGGHERQHEQRLPHQRRGAHGPTSLTDGVGDEQQRQPGEGEEQDEHRLVALDDRTTGDQLRDTEEREGQRHDRLDADEHAREELPRRPRIGGTATCWHDSGFVSVGARRSVRVVV